MVETEEHKKLKSCAARIFQGLTEKPVNGRVDVKTESFCVEVETSGRNDRLQHAIEKLSSSKCKGGFLIVPPNALAKHPQPDESVLPQTIPTFRIPSVVLLSGYLLNDNLLFSYRQHTHLMTACQPKSYC